MRLHQKLTPTTLFEFLDGNHFLYDEYREFDPKCTHLWAQTPGVEHHIQFSLKYDTPPRLNVTPGPSIGRRTLVLILNRIWQDLDYGELYEKHKAQKKALPEEEPFF